MLRNRKSSCVLKKQDITHYVKSIEVADRCSYFNYGLRKGCSVPIHSLCPNLRLSDSTLRINQFWHLTLGRKGNKPLLANVWYLIQHINKMTKTYFRFGTAVCLLALSSIRGPSRLSTRKNTFPLPYSEKVPGLTQGLSVCSRHVLPVSAWLLSGSPGFLPQRRLWV